jgi:hypothetical protein
VPSKQRVAGSNPAGRTSLFSQFKPYGGAQADHVAAFPLTGSCHKASQFLQVGAIFRDSL